MPMNSVSMLYCVGVTVLICYGPQCGVCFQQIVTKHPICHPSRHSVGIRQFSNLYFFFGKGNKDKIDEKNDTSNIATQQLERKEELSFIDRVTRRITKTDPDAIGDNSSRTSVEKSTSKSISELNSANQPLGELTLAELAAKLRADAQRARLEAEKMDAELTLKKIDRLERELEYARLHPEKVNAELSQQMQREMDIFQSKLRGEAVKPAATPSVSSSSSSKAKSGGSSDVQNLVRSRNDVVYEGRLSSVVRPFDPKKFEEYLKTFENAPSFMKKAVAVTYRVPFDKADDINVTEVAMRQDMAARLDFSFTDFPAPKFTLKEIKEKENQILEMEKSQNVWWNPFSGLEQLGSPELMEERVSGLAKDNITEFALLVLEYEYYMSNLITVDDDDGKQEKELEKVLEGEEWLKPLAKRLNSTFTDTVIESLYPKCTRREDKEPTINQVQLLVSDILPKASFQASSKTEKVTGGYIIRGKTRLNGDDLITKIEALVEKAPSLSKKMTILYAKDFTEFDNSEEIDPILYVVGSDIVREAKPVQLSIVSAIGIATSWYLSLYPFLLNPTIAARVDEQIAIADASMTSDLGWLADLSFPLFVTFIGIQLVHEVAHRVVAGFNNIKTSAPTFVPSIITGITSSVTTFRNPPRNRAAMFDFSIAGPLAGIMASIFAIVVGSQLTLVSDPSAFPALPLEILRQSTLGGTIINEIIGNGALSVPEGALGTAAVATMTVPLHPVAIAGYISLIVNALCVLPVGTTDGGRIALALFGREVKLGIGNIFLLAILFVGLVGSDLFLFYFAFLIAFQTGNEIPALNEVDSIDFPRALLATLTFSTAFLCLVPFQ